MGKNIKIGIIGCGNMGSAIAQGVVDRGVSLRKNISLCDKIKSKTRVLAKKIGAAYGDLSCVVHNSNILIIAVKPQDFNELFSSISKDLQNKVLVSIMTGVSIKDIEEKVGRKTPIARAMPNMAAFVGESITSICYNKMVKNKNEVRNIFSSIGNIVEVDESFMDAVTSLSGSGPAYLFYLAEAMMDAGKSLGLDSNTVTKLVIQTLYGASLLLKEGRNSSSELIKKVASKGGTTEAALTVFRDKKLKSIIKSAIVKAKERARELSVSLLAG